MSKFTKWFPANIKPVRKGIYQTIVPNVSGLYFSKFDGKFWLRDRYELEMANLESSPSYCQNRQWRGLAKKP